MVIRLDAPRADAATLTGRLAAGRARARALGRPVLVSVVEPVACPRPLDLFARGQALTSDRLYWEQPSERFALVGLGVAYAIAGEGDERFVQAGAAWRALLADALIEGAPSGRRGTGPLLLGGFAFDPARPGTALWRGYPDARLVLPRLLLSIDGDDAWLTLNAVIGPQDEPETLAAEWARLRAGALGEGLHPPTPSPNDWARGSKYDGELGSPLSQTSGEGLGVRANHWQATVAEAAAAVRRGDFAKVVLARSERLEAAAPIDVIAALGRLRKSYPTCYVFAVARGDAVFLGASPERLVRLQAGEVRATCLAGSTPRGATPEEDAALGAGLLASAKDRVEHAIVVDALRASLAGLCDDVTMPDAPSLLSVRNVHHLYTPIVARPRAGVTLLDLIARAHPTPAVGGAPREVALRFIREREGLDRGWYAGPVGWIGGDGGGEFAVALRSALVRGNLATLFAGCGIVADSEPAQEYAETLVKLRPMLGALGGAER